MFVVIYGGGKVGEFLASTLYDKGHQVTVIEDRADVVQKLAEELPSKVLLISGIGSNVRTLEEAGVNRADVFAAVTRQDEENLVSCQLARIHCGVKRAVARVNNPNNEGAFHALGIEGISSTTIISRMIEEELVAGEIINLMALKKGQVNLVETQVPEDKPSPHRPVAELGLPPDIILITIIRGEEFIIPRGKTVVLPGDRVLAVVRAGQEHELTRLLHGQG
jgi:trk system potassium uptake protein TrkA